MRAAVQTARLVAEAAVKGRAPGRYASLALSEAEVDAGSIAESFKRVQPPSQQVHQLREELTLVVDASSSTMASLRIAVYGVTRRALT